MIIAIYQRRFIECPLELPENRLDARAIFAWF
jgi:hypothetical protein